MARELSGALAAAGAVVISGLAQGIDSVAHAAAVAAEGRTIAVLGEGLAAFEGSGPLRRQQLAVKIRGRGALVSEYATDVRPTAWTFPRRNATIAALSDALVVVEAPETSGALITADRALRMRRPVYAVPGPLGAPTWLGSNRLIADGRANLLLDAGVVAALLGLRLVPAEAPTASETAERLLALLAAGAADADAIAAGLGIALRDATTLIAELLIDGQVLATGDGRFARR